MRFVLYFFLAFFSNLRYLGPAIASLVSPVIYRSHGKSHRPGDESPSELTHKLTGPQCPDFRC